MRAILLHLAPSTIYLALALSWHLRSSAHSGALARASLLAGLLLHGASLAVDLIGGEARPHFGFSLALSMTLWLALSFYWIESFFAHIDGLQVLALPIAAIAAALPLVFPGQHPLPNADSLVFLPHFIVAMLAYSLLTLAALHALMIAATRHHLHRARSSRILAALPPLMTQESLLFRLIWAGFILLTLTLCTGVFFSEAIFGTPAPLSHKTVFAFAAWLVFGTLLVGRVVKGWRGKKALRLTLAGFVFLLFAYVGTRFMLEVLQGRGI